ncbi:uncharacterized protein LOC123563284 [Mercenaria mercenaria]|uniref:uncharacterized protein LOC123563284 n=1 Tax=Mercenaria mercenaria TaxID=6596 RepID=UPI00234EABB1|nr:uncharacterized protein LOC123563284 [Mercenaria mercenaria]XP_045211937.2 uncharacterized protein LOC123563284 [Mercenaria mercenaria]
MAPLEIRYEAAMVLSAVGDSLGYKNGNWLECTRGPHIYKELTELGGVKSINIKPPEWRLSYCTLLHRHTAHALTIDKYKTANDFAYWRLAKYYQSDIYDIDKRHPDETFFASRELLNPDIDAECMVPFNDDGVSSAAAVRAMCIGLRHPNDWDVNNLIKLSIESGRMTHHHPVGYLGSLVTALFTSYAIQKIQVRQWGSRLMKIFPKALEYVKEQGIAVDENVRTWDEFIDKWKTYIKLRGIETGTADPIFPDGYNSDMSEEFYKSISTDRPGRSACEATLIAYDAFLSFDGSWEDLCVRSICHGGLSNVTCAIAACWYGAMYGYDEVNKCNYTTVELMKQIAGLGELLYHHSDHSFLHKVEELPFTLPTENPVELNVALPEVDDYIYVREGKKNLNSLIDEEVDEIRKDVTTDEAVSIGNAIYSHLRHFLDELGTKDPECKVSELLKVGSFHEGTKIFSPDEFDFIAILSELSKPGAFTVISSLNEDDRVDLHFGNDSIASTLDKEKVSHAASVMERFSTKLYNTIMTDRKSKASVSLFCHHDRTEWIALPPMNKTELSVRFCEARLPNMVWEFLYQNRRISVDITIAIKYSNVDELYNPEVATIPTIGKAVTERGSLLLVAYIEGFRKTFTETEVHYVRTCLGKNHKTLYMFLKHLSYKYGEHPFLQLNGYHPFSSYMLKTICIYHDQNCKAETAEHEACLQDIVAIMDESINNGYLHEAEMFEETVIGYLPSMFNKSKNLYKEPEKPVDRLKELRKVMIRDIRQIYLSGKKWSGLRQFMKEANDVTATSAEEVCSKDWSDSHGLIMMKVK